MRKTCIVLAGGLGTRLRSAVQDLPKCLAPVSGRPFLEWQLRSLAARGVEDFVLALGYRADDVYKAVRQPWASGLSINVVTEHEALGTGGAARLAMDEVGLDEALVTNGDTFLCGDLTRMLDPLDFNNGELMRIATVEVQDRRRFGGVAVGMDRRVSSFQEKGQSDRGLINAGLYRVHRKAFADENRAAFSLENHVMPRLVLSGRLRASELSGPFIDIGMPDDYYRFNKTIDSYVDQDESGLS